MDQVETVAALTFAAIVASSLAGVAFIRTRQARLRQEQARVRRLAAAEEKYGAVPYGARGAIVPPDRIPPARRQERDRQMGLERPRPSDDAIISSWSSPDSGGYSGDCSGSSDSGSSSSDCG